MGKFYTEKLLLTSHLKSLENTFKPFQIRYTLYQIEKKYGKNEVKEILNELPILKCFYHI